MPGFEQKGNLYKDRRLLAGIIHSFCLKTRPVNYASADLKKFGTSGVVVAEEIAKIRYRCLHSENETTLNYGLGKNKYVPSVEVEG